MTVPARKVWRRWREAERRACRSSDKWGVALTLILAACGGRNHYAEEDVSIPLTQITEGIATDSVPFAAIVPQRNAGNQYLSPKDARLNPEPVGLDFDPSPSLPEGFGPISAWTGRAGSIDGLAFSPRTGKVSGYPSVETTVFLQAVNAAGDIFDVVVPIVFRSVLGDSSRTTSQTLDGEDGTAWLVLGSSSDDILSGGDRPDDFRGGEGNDTVSYTGSGAGVTVRLADDGTAIEASGGHAEGDVMHSIENLEGSGFDDVLHGNVHRNEFTGGAGKDVFGIDIQMSSLEDADVIHDFQDARRDAGASTVIDQLRFVGLKTGAYFTFLHADLEKDGNENDMVIFGEEVSNLNYHNKVLVILKDTERINRWSVDQAKGKINLDFNPESFDIPPMDIL